MKRLEQRWQRRWEGPAAGPPRTHRLVETAKLRHRVDRVWDLVLRPECAPLLLPQQVARGFTVPGSPSGLGEQQCFLDLDGNPSIYELVEHVPPRRAVARLVSPATAVPIRGTHTIEPLGDACILRIGLEWDAERGLPVDAQQQWYVGARDYLERVRRVLAEDGPAAGQLTPEA